MIDQNTSIKTKVISSTEIQQRFGAVLDWIRNTKKEVVIKIHGEPEFIVMRLPDYKKLQESQEREQRRELFRQLEQIREKVRTNNEDLTEYMAIGIGNQVVRDSINSLVSKGDITFE